MSKTIFQHIANITHIKADPNKYSESDWKSYSPYMINRWLSMAKEYADVIDKTQKYYNLPKRAHYKMLCGVLPKRKVFTRYVKSKRNKKYNPDLVDALTRNYEVSKTEVKGYIDLAMNDELLLLNIKNVLQRYGFSEKDINKLVGNNK
jgi:hypothetical protein